MKKRVLSLILAAVMTISLSAAAFATEYSDLKGHWAATYMEALAAKGYLTGYTDGTMQPDKNITTCETLALLSRFYALTDSEAALIQKDYGTTVSGLVSPTLSWAYKSIQTDLAAGIISLTELKSISLTAAIKKEQFAVFLVRALQLTNEANALSSTKLSFADAASVSAGSVGSVAELVSLGIVKGDTLNNFAPQSSVTRAVVATMISRSLDYLTTKGKTLTIGDYSGVVRYDGIISSADSASVVVRGYDGFSRQFALSSASVVTVNGGTKTLSSAYVGCSVTVSAKKDSISKLAITSDTTVTWLQGAITSISTGSTYGVITIENLSTGAVTSYNVATDAKITQDGATKTFANLTYNNFVTLKYVGGKVTEITSVSGAAEVSGSVSEIKYGTTVTLTVTDATGAKYRFLLDISKLPTIKRGDAAITIDRLTVGNKITVTTKNCKVSLIESDDTSATVSGELSTVTTTAVGTSWTIKNSSGISATYTLDDDAAAYSGTTRIVLSTIKAGDTVSVLVYGTTITEVHLTAAAASATKLTGIVLTVNTESYTITVLSSADKLIYISTASAAIMKASTGSIISLSAIAVGAEFTAYGTYGDSRNFAAKSIIIE